MEKQTVGDIDICYEVRGEGPPLVMIMGLTANIDWWPPELLRALESRYRLLLLDNRGAGRTPPGEGAFTIKRFADDTAGLMDALGIEHAHVMGVSMGGMIAQELVLQHPEKVDGLVLCCTFCGGVHAARPGLPVLATMARRSPDPEVQARRALSVLFPGEWLAEHPETTDNFIGRVSIAFITPENARRQIGAVLRFNTYGRLPLIDKRTLVLCGSEDMLVPPRNSRILTSRIPDARLREFAGAGHGFINQCCDGVAAAVDGFLSAN